MKILTVSLLTASLLAPLACGSPPDTGTSSAADTTQPATVPNLYSYWSLPPTAAGYYNIDSRIRVDLDPGASVSMAWASQFYFVGNAVGGFIGLEEGGGGKLAFVSIWGATAAAALSGAACSDLGSAGPGYRCTLAYPWAQGHTYRLRLWVLSLSAGLWQTAILDEQSGVESIIGNFTIPPNVVLDAPVSEYTQNFGGSSYPSCSVIPTASATFFAPTALGYASSPRVVAAPTSTKISSGTCTNVAVLTSPDSTFEVQEYNVSELVDAGAPDSRGPVDAGTSHDAGTPVGDGASPSEGGGPSCGAVPDGLYCGSSDAIVGGDPGTLYECAAGAISVEQLCPCGCVARGAGADRCKRRRS